MEICHLRRLVKLKDSGKVRIFLFIMFVIYNCRWRSKRVKVDYSKDAFSHICDLEKNTNSVSANGESDQKKEKRKHRRSEHTDSDEQQNKPVVRHITARPIRQCEVVLERIKIRKRTVKVSQFLRRQQRRKFQSKEYMVVLDTPSPEEEEPVEYSSYNDDESSRDSGKSGKSSKKKKESYHKRLENAFCKSSKRVKRKASSNKLLSTLDPLHQATLSNLTNIAKDSYSDLILEDDHDCEFEDVMYKLALYSPPVSDHGNLSPPQAMSPTRDERADIDIITDEFPRTTRHIWTMYSPTSPTTAATGVDSNQTTPSSLRDSPVNAKSPASTSSGSSKQEVGSPGKKAAYTVKEAVVKIKSVPEIKSATKLFSSEEASPQKNTSSVSDSSKSQSEISTSFSSKKKSRKSSASPELFNPFIDDDLVSVKVVKIAKEQSVNEEQTGGKATDTRQVANKQVEKALDLGQSQGKAHCVEPEAASQKVVVTERKGSRELDEEAAAEERRQMYQLLQEGRAKNTQEKDQERKKSPKKDARREDKENTTGEKREKSQEKEKLNEKEKAINDKREKSQEKEKSNQKDKTKDKSTREREMEKTEHKKKEREERKNEEREKRKSEEKEKRKGEERERRKSEEREQRKSEEREKRKSEDREKRKSEEKGKRKSEEREKRKSEEREKRKCEEEEKRKSEEREKGKSKSTDKSHSKYPKTKTFVGEEKARPEKQQKESKKDSRKTRLEVKKLHYGRVPSPIHAPSDEEVPVVEVKKRRKDSSPSSLTIDKTAEKKRRGRPPKHRQDEAVIDMKEKEADKTSMEHRKDKHRETSKVMSEKVDKGNVPIERQKSLADELLGSVSEDSSSDDEPLVSKRIRSPVHSPEDSPRAKIIPSPVPSTIHVRKDKHRNEVKEPKQEKERSAKMIENPSTSMEVNATTTESSQRKERVELVLQEKDTEKSISLPVEKEIPVEKENDDVCMVEDMEENTVSRPSNVAESIVLELNILNKVMEQTTDDVTPKKVDAAMTRQFSEQEEKLLSKITESDSDVDMDEETNQRNKPSVRGQRAAMGEKQENKVRSEESSEEEEDQCERIDVLPQSPSPPAKVKPSEELFAGNEFQEKKDENEMTDAEVPDDHHDADNEESKSEDGSKVERIEAPPRSPSPLAAETSRSDTNDLLKDQEKPTEVKDKDATLVLEKRNDKAAKSSSEHENSSSDEESQHAKLMSPPRFPSPVHDEANKEEGNATATVTADGLEVKDIDGLMVRGILDDADKQLGKKPDELIPSKQGDEETPCEEGESSDSEDEQRKKHLKMASPPRSPSPVKNAEDENKTANEKVNEDIEEVHVPEAETFVSDGHASRKELTIINDSDSVMNVQRVEEEHEGKSGESSSGEQSSEEEGAENRKRRARMISPPRSPSPQNMVAETVQEVSFDENKLDKEDSSEDDDSSEDEEEKQRKRMVRMASPPRSPSPTRPSVPEQSAVTISSDTTTNQITVDLRKEQSSDDDDFEDDESEDKQIKMASPPRSPSPMRSSEAETNSTVRELMLEDPVEKSKNKRKAVNEDDSSENEETMEPVTRILSPPASPSVIRSPDAGHTASDIASSDVKDLHEESSSEENEDSDDEQREVVMVSSPPRSPSPMLAEDAALMTTKLTSEEGKREAESGEESSEDEEEEKNRTTRIASPPRSPSPVNFPEANEIGKSLKQSSSEKSTEIEKESSSEDEDEDEEMGHKTIVMSPPRSPLPIRSVESEVKISESHVHETQDITDTLMQTTKEIDSLNKELEKLQQKKQDAEVVSTSYNTSIQIPNDSDVSEVSLSSNIKEQTGKGNDDEHNEKDLDKGSEESSSEEESETEEEAAARRQRTLMASPPASPSPVKSDEPQEKTNQNIDERVVRDLRAEFKEQSGNESWKEHVEFLTVDSLCATEEVIIQEAEEIITEDQTLEVSDAVEKNGAVHRAEETFVIEAQEVEVATEEVETSVTVQEDIHVNGVRLDGNIDEASHNSPELETVEEEVLLEVPVTEDHTIVDTNLPEEEAVNEQAQTLTDEQNDCCLEESEVQNNTCHEEVVEAPALPNEPEVIKDSENQNNRKEDPGEAQDKDDDEVKIIAETIDDFVIIPNEDYSESGSEIVDVETQAKEISTKRQIQFSTTNKKAYETTQKVNEKEKENNENQPKEPEKEVRKQINIQLLKEYGKKIYGKSSTVKSARSVEEVKKNKWDGLKMMLRESSVDKSNVREKNTEKEQNAQREDVTANVTSKKDGISDADISKQDRSRDGIVMLIDHEEDSETPDLSDVIGDIVNALSSEEEAEKEVEELTQETTSATQIVEVDRQVCKTQDTEIKAGESRTLKSALSSNTVEEECKRKDELSKSEDHATLKEQEVASNPVTLGGRKDQTNRKNEEENSEDETSDEENEEEAAARIRRERNKMASPPRSPSPVHVAEETALERKEKQHESSDEDDESEAEERTEKVRMTSPPRSPSPEPPNPAIEEDLRDNSDKINKTHEESSEESENETEGYVMRREMIPPPRSPSPVRSTEVKTSEMKEENAPEKEQQGKEQEHEDTSSEESDDESEEAISRKRKMMSPPRSPSPVKSDRTSKDNETSEEVNDCRKESSDEESDSDDEAEVKRKRIRIESPPRSPSPIRFPRHEQQTSNETVKDCGEEAVLDNEHRKEKSPPKSPSAVQVSKKIHVECDPKDEMPTEEKQTESSSEDESEEEDNERIKMISPPGSPEPETEDIVTADKDNERQEESSSEESEDEIENQGVTMDSPSRSPSPVKSVENTQVKVNEVQKSAEQEEKTDTLLSEEEPSEDEAEQKCLRMDSPPKSPSPIRSEETTVEEVKDFTQSSEGNDKHSGADRHSSSDEESEDEHESMNHTKEVTAPRSPSPAPNNETVNKDDTGNIEKNECSDESDEEDTDNRRKCLRMMTPPRSLSPLRSEVQLMHTEDLLRPRSDVANTENNGVRSAVKHKLSNHEDSSDGGSDCEGTKVKCVRLDSQPRSPSPPRDCEPMETGHMSRHLSHNRHKAGLDLSMKPRHRVSSKENCDTCDSDDDSDEQSGSEGSVRLPSPVSIRSPTPPPIMSPDYEPTAIDLSMKHDHMIHPVPEYTDGPRDQKEYTSQSDQTVVIIPSDYGLVPPGFEEDETMELSDYSPYDPMEEVPGVIDLATTRRGKKSASQSNSQRSVKSVDRSGRDQTPPPLRKRPERKQDEPSGGDDPPKKSKKSSKKAQAHIYTPLEAPPSRESVIADIIPLGLSQEHHQDAYFGNPADVPERPR